MPSQRPFVHEKPADLAVLSTHVPKLTQTPPKFKAQVIQGSRDDIVFAIFSPDHDRETQHALRQEWPDKPFAVYVDLKALGHSDVTATLGSTQVLQQYLSDQEGVAGALIECRNGLLRILRIYHHPSKLN